MAVADHTTGASSSYDERACPQCDGRPASPLARYSTPDWSVVTCVACGFVYLRNPPAYEALVEEFAWEKASAAETVRRRKTRPLLMWLDRATRWRLHMLRGTRQDFYRRLFRPGRVLDVGCGSGTGLPETFIPYGIEISQALYERAKINMVARGGDVLHGGAADAIAAFPDRYFTGVVMSSVVEHERSPRQLLAHVARVLEDDGKAYIRVPNFGSINRAVGGANWCGFRHPDHVNYFTVASLRRMVAACKLKIRLLNPVRLPLDDNINAVLSKV